MNSAVEHPSTSRRERAPERTHTLPPIAELIASLSLSEAPPTETVSSSGSSRFSPSSESTRSFSPSSPTRTLPSLSELALPDPLALRQRALEVDNGKSSSSSEASPKTTDVVAASTGVVVKPPISPDQYSPHQRSPQSLQNNTINHSNNVRSPPIMHPRPSHPVIPIPPASNEITFVNEPTDPPDKQPPRMQGRRTDLIMQWSDKQKRSIQGAFKSVPSSGPPVIVERAAPPPPPPPLPVEGKGWTDDSQKYVIQRFSLSMREKEQKKRRTVSDPYPCRKNAKITVDGMVMRKAIVVDTIIKRVAPPPQKPTRASQRGKRRDLHGWKD